MMMMMMMSEFCPTCGLVQDTAQPPASEGVWTCQSGHFPPIMSALVQLCPTSALKALTANSPASRALVLFEQHRFALGIVHEFQIPFREAFASRLNTKKHWQAERGQ